MFLRPSGYAFRLYAHAGRRADRKEKADVRFFPEMSPNLLKGAVMADIVERLREQAKHAAAESGWGADNFITHEAADAIERLRRRVTVLEMIISEELDPYDCCDDANEMIVQQIRDRKDASSSLTSKHEAP